ncbi:hypothetical protein NVP1101O_124 [Vibrio phage 1.101.O._10N.261.45.C6]|nr:hypothetical protein NVP1101O_124 [Vibrio phage 1.101.O._10N.261.45.C6]
MKNKLNIWKERAEFVIDLIRDFPKITIIITTLFSVGTYALVTRTPAAVSCTWQAVVVQEVPWEKWQYNWMANQCQYFNGTRFIPLGKVMDVGAADEGIQQ